jgi:selenocysteine lyase/cysteine desulfurase
MLSDQDVLGLRAQFPVFRDKVFLNSCSQGALSGSVRAGMLEYLDSWDRLGSPWEQWTEHYERVRGEFARTIGAQPHEVAVLTSVSQGISAVATALDFKDRPKVVMGEFEFPTMGHVWLAQRPRGAHVEFVHATGNRVIKESYERAIDGRTAIVPVTGVCYMNGARSDVAGVTRAAHAQGALVMLDDYQDAGTRPVDVKALDVDFYVTGTLKYLLGPSGLAFLYVREELIERLQPSTSGWFAQSNPFAFDVRSFDPAPDARRFQAGTPPVPNLFAALPGFQLLQKAGPARIADHIARLSRAVLDGARRIGIAYKTPDDTVGPLIVLKARDAARVVALLAEQNIVASSRLDGLRISLHLYNTMSDVEAVLDVLERNAGLLVRASEGAMVQGAQS